MSRFIQALEGLIKTANGPGWGGGDGALSADNMTVANLPEGVATVGGMGLKGVQDEKKDPTLEWIEALAKKNNNA